MEFLKNNAMLVALLIALSVVGYMIFNHYKSSHNVVVQKTISKPKDVF